MQFLLPWLAIAHCLANDMTDDGPVVERATAVELPAVDAGRGWTRWDGIGVLKGAAGNRERATSLHIAQDGGVWVGTSYGRLLRYANQGWTLEVNLSRLQITGIAVQHDVLWLSTSDGMIRLRRPKEQREQGEGWVLERFREYYAGHPSFVSGAYLPGEDSVRLWGRVDGVFVPDKLATYAPFVISEEHGLFSWGGYNGVWHHFLPHFWGANSEWLDTRELIVHRRPTCLAEDKDGNLWIGTDGDGLVRINSHARRFHERSPADNGKDGKEFTPFLPDDVGCEFTRVNHVCAGLVQGVWVALSGNDKRRYIARFRDGSWSLFELPKIERKTHRGTTVTKTEWWEPIPLCIAEVAPDRLLVGVKDAVWPAGLFELDWARQTFEKVGEVEHAVHNLQRAADGAVWAQTWWGVYCRKSK